MGTSADKVKVGNNPIVKKMSVNTADSLFFMMTPPGKDLTPPFNRLFESRLFILSLLKKIKANGETIGEENSK